MRTILNVNFLDLDEVFQWRYVLIDSSAHPLARHDGVKDQQRANAYQRLQYVCGALVPC